MLGAPRCHLDAITATSAMMETPVAARCSGAHEVRGRELRSQTGKGSATDAELCFRDPAERPLEGSLVAREAAATVASVGAPALAASA